MELTVVRMYFGCWGLSWHLYVSTIFIWQRQRNTRFNILEGKEKKALKLRRKSQRSAYILTIFLGFRIWIFFLTLLAFESFRIFALFVIPSICPIQAVGAQVSILAKAEAVNTQYLSSARPIFMYSNFFFNALITILPNEIQIEFLFAN